MPKVVSLLIVMAVVLAAHAVPAHVPPQPQPVPLDFITGGGWFIIQQPAVNAQPGTRANFGWHGGVKNGNWWGNGNYIDHGTGLHVRSLTVTGYLRIGVDGTDANGQPTGTRDICGTARTNLHGDVFYRVRMKDAGEPGRQDQFAIALFTSQSGGLVYLARGSLGDPAPGGGNIQLHRGNPSNTAPTTGPLCPPDPFDGDLGGPPPPPTPSDTTPPSVSITSPAGGSTVSGTVTVSASASDDVGVAGVQFLVDGGALGAEDTAAPFAVSWDTRSVANGSHTLTAVARDAAGNRTTSAPVTVNVSNVTTGPTVTRVEDTDPAVSYTANWFLRERPDLSGGTARVADEAGQRATLSFTGTGVSWISFRFSLGGIARVFLDGTLRAEVDTFAPAEEPQAVVFSATGLPSANHTLVIEVTGTKNPSSGHTWIVVDAFDVAR